MPPPVRLLDRAERLPLFGLAAAAMLAGLLARPIVDVDIFWQLRLGDLALDAGRLPDREPFLAGRADAPLVPVAWLAQVAYAAVRRVGGWSLVQIADAGVWFGGLLAVAIPLRRRSARAWPAAAALAVGYYLAYPHGSVRPQSFALLGFGLLIALVRSDLPDRRKVLLGAVLLVAWQNLHPSAATAGAYLGAVAAAGWGRRWLTRAGPWPWAAALLIPVAAGAVFLTPAGAALVPLSLDNADISRRLGVGEWQPLIDPPGRDMIAAGDWGDLIGWWFDCGRVNALVVLAATAGAVARRGRRVPAEDLAGAAAFGLLTVATFRFALFFAAAVIPVWYAVLSGGPLAERVGSAAHSRSEWATRGGLLLAWVLAVTVPMAAKPALFAGTFPFAGAAALDAAGVTGPVYCHYFWGGILSDRGPPGRRVTHDGRYYLRTPAEWAAHAAARAGEVPPADLDAEFRPGAYFLLPATDAGLIARLRAAPGWREVFAGGTAVVFVRAAGR